MNNTEYVEKMINNAERILVDTSTLMRPEFQQFVSRNKKLLVSSGKPIIVINAVYAELARKMRDDEMETVQAAVDAVGLLCLNNDVFYAETSSLTDDDIERAFADPELLSDLTVHRNRCRQLLIVNDQNLGKDAFNLNKLASCIGHKVYVCYINGAGELQCSDCARPKTEVSTKETSQFTHETTIQVTQIEKSSKTLGSKDSEWIFDWKSGLLVATGMLPVYGAYRLIKSFF